MAGKTTKTVDLSMREAEVLASINAAGESYGLEIRATVNGTFGIKMPLGSLYTTMKRLEAKGLVTSREGKTEHPEGGNDRKYFKRTPLANVSLDAWKKRVAKINELLK